jgi:hypothetical protein
MPCASLIFSISSEENQAQSEFLLCPFYVSHVIDPSMLQHQTSGNRFSHFMQSKSIGQGGKMKN